MTEQKYVLIETTSTFRIRYLFKAESVDKAKDLIDLITSGQVEIKEFSQEHLGEEITNTIPMSEECAIAKYREDNAHCNFEFNPWSDELILKNMVNE
jgi:hypothetical protein